MDDLEIGMQNDSSENKGKMQRAQNKKSPKEIIEEGIRRSTKISDEKTINVLKEKAMQADSCTKVKGYDSFLFNIAESLENVRCETTSANEYFSWINESNHIMKKMTDGYVTEEDLHERNHFITMSWQRETELLTCLALYEQSDNPLAKKRYAELRLKLVRLRQIRSALMINTKNASDKGKLTEAERARLRKTIRTLEEMREYDENGDYNNQVLLARLRELQISHERDFEFYKGYSFYTRMLEDERHSETSGNTRQNLAVLLSEKRHKEDSREDIRNRIFRLTGRRVHEHSDNNIREIRENAFNANGFRRLKELRDLQNENE